MNSENKFSMLLSDIGNNILKLAPCIGCNEFICEPEFCGSLDNWVKSSMKGVRD